MRKIRVYVASSWRNERQPEVVKVLREAGHEVYDFRNPDGGTDDSSGFSWSSIDPNWQNWNASQHLAALANPLAKEGFKKDFDAMKWADICVLVTPSGRSAHIEAGWMQGSGRPVIALLDNANPQEPNLMYGCFTVCITELDQLDKYTRVIGVAAQKTDLLRECRVCGCTDNDCSQCVAKTGEPCHWVAEDLCSACSRIPINN